MAEVNIIKYLQSFSENKPIFYYPNPGVGGDALIACATFQLFNDLKINYRFVDWQKFDPVDKILFYGGGGNLVPYYSFAREIIAKYHNRVKKLVILPHTISNNEDLLMEFGKNVDIICREKVSYEHVKRSAPKANVLLSDDMVFYLDVKKALPPDNGFLMKAAATYLKYIFMGSDHKINLNLSALKQLIRFFKKEAVLTGFIKRNDLQCLNCFRTDKEQAEIKLPENNIDLSRILSYDASNQAITLLISNQLLRFINRFAKIETDRLHLAIAAALLNKNVDFYRNSYFKNEAVYRYSMEKRFPNVRWMG